MFVRLALFPLQQPRAEHDAVAAVVQLEREDQNVPIPSRALGRQVGDAALSTAVNIGFAGIGHGADDFAELVAQLGILLEEVFSPETKRACAR